MKLKAKYGENWMEYYETYKNCELYKTLDLNAISSKNNKGYIPKGNISKKLFDGSTK